MVWRLELEMIGWDPGCVCDWLPEKEDYDLDIEPDRVDERLVDTVWLRVKRWQSLPGVFNEEKEDHVFFFERYVKTECVLVEGLERSNTQGKDLRQNHEQAPVRVTWTEMTKAFHATVFSCQRKNSIAPKAAKKSTKERKIAWCRQKNRIANGAGRDSNFHTEAGEGKVTELHGMSTVSTCSSLYSSASFQCQEEEHSIWNSVLGLYCHYHVGQYIEEILTEEEMGRIALHWRFALDL